MKRVEVIGVTGVGKSTLVKALTRKHKKVTDPDALVFDTWLQTLGAAKRNALLTVDRTLAVASRKENPLTNFLLPRAYEYAIWKWGRGIPEIDDHWHTYLTCLASGIKISNNPPSRLFMYQSLKAFATAQIAQHSQNTEKTLLHDEGIAYRFSDLTSRGAMVPDLKKIIDLFPPRAVLHVTASKNLQIERRIRRSLLKGKSVKSDEVKKTQQQMARGFDIYTGLCREKNIPVFNIDANNDIHKQVEGVEAALASV